MDAQEKYEYWLEIAQYDLETAEAMFASGRWLYVVFMCQQAIEKLVKGLYTLYIDDNVPHIHDISRLIKKFEKQLSVPVAESRYDLFDALLSFYINGRYVDFKKKLSERLNANKARDILHESRETFAWLLTLKP